MESERTREFRRKKYSNSKEKEEKNMKRPIILLKTKANSGDQASNNVSSGGAGGAQKTILLKTRDGEKKTASPQIPSTSSLSSSTKSTRENENSTPSYQIASRVNPPEVASQIPTQRPLMKEPVKLLDDESLTLKESLIEHLTESTDFLVVGCLGPQGVGKSTLMSHLAYPPTSDHLENPLFKIQSESQIDSATHCTEGIDAFVTKERVILLDTQPLLSLSVLSKYYMSDNCTLTARSCSRDDPDYPCLENDLELLSLQYAAFLLTICHVVLIVQDFTVDPDFIRFIQTAEMIKPSSGIHANEDTLLEYYPHCVLVHTKSQPISFSRMKVKSLQETYKFMFSQSQLPIQSGIGIANGLVTKSLSPELCETEPVNVFVLPAFEKKKLVKTYDGFDYASLLQSLRYQINGLTPSALTHTVLTEKNWWHYAAKIWEDVKKSPLVPEYGRLLPNPSAAKADT